MPPTMGKRRGKNPDNLPGLPGYKPEKDPYPSDQYFRFENLTVFLGSDRENMKKRRIVIRWPDGHITVEHFQGKTIDDTRNAMSEWLQAQTGYRIGPRGLVKER